ncbi:MaoC like domain-containing protein [Aspergillus filifer]
MSLPTIQQLRWTSSTTFNASTIITYNLSIGCSGLDLPLTYELHRQFHALPTFTSIPIIDIMGKVTRDMPSFLPGFDPKRYPHVHAEQYLEMKRVLPRDGTLISEARVLDVINRKSGVAVIVAISTRDVDRDEAICYAEWTSFLIGMPGIDASKPSPRNTRPSTSLPNRPPDATSSHKTTPEQNALYRAATGEWNPMHIDPGTAKAAGFPGPVLSGTCTIGIGVRHVIEHFARGEVGRFRIVKSRLSKPVFPGEEVRTEMWRESGGRILYRQVGEDGRVVISQAEVRLTDEEEGVSSQL